jgi:hypothetical protein
LRVEFSEQRSADSGQAVVRIAYIVYIVQGRTGSSAEEPKKHTPRTYRKKQPEVGVYKYMRIYLYTAFSIKDFYIGGFRRNDVGTFAALRVAG